MAESSRGVNDGHGSAAAWSAASGEDVVEHSKACAVVALKDTSLMGEVTAPLARPRSSTSTGQEGHGRRVAATSLSRGKTLSRARRIATDTHGWSRMLVRCRKTKTRVKVPEGVYYAHSTGACHLRDNAIDKQARLRNDAGAEQTCAASDTRHKRSLRLASSVFYSSSLSYRLHSDVETPPPSPGDPETRSATSCAEGVPCHCARRPLRHAELVTTRRRCPRPCVRPGGKWKKGGQRIYSLQRSSVRACRVRLPAADGEASAGEPSSSELATCQGAEASVIASATA